MKDENRFRSDIPKHRARAVLRYAMLPGIMPRVRELGLNFGRFAYLIALILRSARLIPSVHPCLNPRNIGQYTVTQVLAIGANNITWSARNIDQIGIYVAIVGGLIAIALQALLIVLYAMIGTAHASGTGSFFTTPEANVQTDVVLIFLDQVFGPSLDFFGAATQPLGTPVYEGLHAVLGLYSLVTMVIALIVVVYYIMTVVGEAAQSGTPFGKRFNSLWAPVRLVVALGLLVPLGSGLNSAQYITLGIAKMGSGLATHAWTIFIEEVTAATNIVTKPAGDSTAALVQRILLNEVCSASYNQIEEGSASSVRIVQVTGRRSSVIPNFGNPQSIIDNAGFGRQNAVILAWSDPENNGKRAIDDACGRITVSLTDYEAFADESGVRLDTERWWWDLPLVGREMSDKLGKVNSDVKKAYISEIGRLAEALRPAAVAIAKVKVSVNKKPEYGDESTLDFIPDLLRDEAITTQNNINMSILATFEDISGSEFAKSGNYDEMVKRGWGAAGLWYATLGTINQKYMDAVSSAVPTLDILFSAADLQENERSPLGRLFGISRYSLSSNATTEIETSITYTVDNFFAYVQEATPDAAPLYEDARFQEADAAGAGGWLSKALVWVLSTAE